ncbi:unnamed protein product [Cercopithifilaria johnstoni]|uniref:Phorbol-ester/DAG-type domain-containing protein n=1 Tax=Cercopithifilaria johnstoni TaxID=2874296 RepID=A0A8J2Q3Z9_9BILA|nr:unnamed protein product [Cercopithifilaria johnstoni]
MRVKVIRAQQLGAVNQPYVILEMDEPAQKFQTKHGFNIGSCWEQSFDFDLTPASEEILFEIYEGQVKHSEQNERENDRFLGLAIVGLEEARQCNVNTSYNLKLQGRPYRNDNITGNLIVQFDFYYDPMGNSTGKDKDETVMRNNFNQFCEPISSSTKRPIYGPRDSFGAYDNKDMTSAKTTTVTVKNVPQQSLSDKTKPLTGTTGITTIQQTSTTPMVYDSHKQRIDTDDIQQRYHSDDTIIQQRSPVLNGRHEHVTGEAKQYQQPGIATTSQIQQHVIPGSSTGTTSGTQYLPTRTKDLHTTDVDNYPYHRYDKEETEELIITKPDESQTKEVNEVRQSRGQLKMHDEERSTRKRDRSFFSELRERLRGRRHSKRRAKSCELEVGEMEEAVSLPPSRDISRTRFSEKSGSRYDLRSYDGKSEQSTKSLYKQSTLLLETHENGQKRYYQIPHIVLDEPGATKLLRQGKKLHVYNDHTFVAVKSRSGTICNVCHQRIGRSNFTKQAYQCRDCHTVCHKPCHYKTQSYCTASNVNKLNVVKDVDWNYLLTTNQINEFISEDGV